jgi:peptide/nickel transport system ATP-binding protein
MKSKPKVGVRMKELYSIPGNVPNPVNMPNYCYFRDRCEMRCNLCDGEYPPEFKISASHIVSCWRCDGAGEVVGQPRTVDLEGVLHER